MNKSLMIKLALVVWLVLPAVAVAWHYGPGEYYRQRDEAGAKIAAATNAARAGHDEHSLEDWLEAARQYAEARAALPEDDVAEHRRLIVEEATARMQGGEIFEGMDQLENLLAEIEQDENASAELERNARHKLGAASYFVAWKMRTELATEEEWKPEAERARQQFRLLAESAEGESGSASTVTPTKVSDDIVQSHKENLEAVIRLEQMDLDELMAKPLPKNCNCNCNGNCNNKSLSQQKRKQAQSRSGKKPGKKKDGEKDARKEVKKSNQAGVNQRGEGGS